MKRFYWPLAAAAILATSFAGCTDQPGPFDTETSTRPAESLSSIPAVTVALIAGRTADAGTVTCWLDENVLHVDYATVNGWMLCETHLAVAASLEGIPTTPSGNPMPGEFPFKTVHAPCSSAFGYTVDLDALDLSQSEMLFIAAYAAVRQPADGAEEGAWAQGTRIRPEMDRDRVVRGKGNWAMYFTVNVAELQGLLLWNKLGSATEIGNSVVGPDGVIHGALGYVPCVHGNGFEPMERSGDHNLPDNFIDYAAARLAQQGCIEFWYRPSWRDWRVGHCVELFEFGLPSDYGAPVKVVMLVEYNDWQDVLSFDIYDVVNGLADPWNRASVAIRPSTIPAWTTDEPFHIAFVWNGAAPNIGDRAQMYLNGSRVGTSNYRGNPTFNWPADYTLRLGSRLRPGDWNRHNWEGIEGVVDNIKVWNFAKTDFSDRFEE